MKKTVESKVIVLWENDEKHPYPKGDAVVELPGGDVKFYGAFYGVYLDKPYPFRRDNIPNHILEKIGENNIFRSGW